MLLKWLTELISIKLNFLYKVKFAEPTAENNTRGESTEFGTYELEGTIASLADGKWSITQQFDSKDSALEYLVSLLAAPSP